MAKTDLNTEQKILEAARQVFMEKGMDGARMQDIADRAGINKALLHYYFRNKDKLFDMVFRAAFDNFFPKVAEMMNSDQTLFEKIGFFVSTYMDMLSQNPYLPLFILNEINRNPDFFREKLWRGERPPVEPLAKHIQKEIKSGNIRPIDPRQLILNMVSMCIFPFIAKPMVKWTMQVNEKEFIQLMEQRKKEITQFIIDAIKE